MRKIEGLQFLQNNFPKETIDCVFVLKEEISKGNTSSLSDENLIISPDKTICFHARAAKFAGSEMALYSKRFYNTSELRDFVKEKIKTEGLDFVIHRTSSDYNYFYNIALSINSRSTIPYFSIEIRTITETILKDKDNGGKRMRDFPPDLSLIYYFHHKSPKVLVQNIELQEKLKNHIARMFEIAKTITEINPNSNLEIGGRIYPNGKFNLVECRTLDAFHNQCV